MVGNQKSRGLSQNFSFSAFLQLSHPFSPFSYSNITTFSLKKSFLYGIAVLYKVRNLPFSFSHILQPFSPLLTSFSQKSENRTTSRNRAFFLLLALNVKKGLSRIHWGCTISVSLDFSGWGQVLNSLVVVNYFD
jgi:hypothetical protein